MKELDEIFGLSPQAVGNAQHLLKLMFQCSLEDKYAKPGATFKIPTGNGQADIRFVETVGIRHTDILLRMQTVNWEKERAFVWVDPTDHYFWTIPLEKLLRIKYLLSDGSEPP